MRAFVSVSDSRNIERFLDWMRRKKIEVSEELCDENYDIVVINLPSDLPRAEKRLVESEKLEEAFLLSKAAVHYEDMLPVCDPEDYELVEELFEKAGDVPKSVRRFLSTKALLHSLEYMSRIHTRLSELFGMSNYLHRFWRVEKIILEKSYVEEYLSDLSGRVFIGKENPFTPLYVFAVNQIPEEAVITFNRAVPIYASLKFEDDVRGEVVVYNGHVEKSIDGKLVVSRGGESDVIVKGTDMSIFLDSGGVGYKLEVESTDISDIEKLSLIFSALSPGYTAAVFDETRLIDRVGGMEKISEITNMSEGKVLSVNFPLERVDCSKYEVIIAPEASKKVKDVCGPKIILRKF